MPLVSVITPTYNSSKYICDTIKSVQDQTFKDWELIITDDCSLDNTVSLVTEMQQNDTRIRLFTTKTNSGPAVSRNTAIENSQGRFIAFLDSDDLWGCNKLEIQLSFMKKNRALITYTSYKKIFTDSEDEYKVISPSSISYRDLLFSCKIGCSTVMYDTELIGKVHMPLVLKGQDWGLWLKILRGGEKASGIKDVLTSYRVRKNSVSSNKLTKAYYMWKIFREYENFSFLKSVYFLTSFAVHKIVEMIFESIFKIFAIHRKKN